MNDELMDALLQIAREKDIAPATLAEIIEHALVTAYKKNFVGQTSDIRVEVSDDFKTIQVYRSYTVIDDVLMDTDEIHIDDARLTHPDCKAGDTIEIVLREPALARIAAQTAKQVVVQKLRELERERVFAEYSERINEVIIGVVQRREYRHILVNLGKIEGVIPPDQQVPNEPYRFNDRIKVLVAEVRRTARGPQVILSRNSASLIRRLFELEVPEVADGTVVIQGVAREPGARSKIAVLSRDPKVDPVGSCVGHRGNRVQAVVNELYDEKIDVIRWSQDTAQYIQEALSPAKPSSVRLLPSEPKTALVIVPDAQLSLAIGKSGQNVRLAAKLTHWRIDIRSESQIARETGAGGTANDAATKPAPAAAAADPDTASVAADSAPAE
ncbi:MAG: transcription termination/antitermination protein NusA [Chthonomonadales bacterium]|nr:transcription termination/antitermination protein NusA [Chthonomonadales bacterium]